MPETDLIVIDECHGVAGSKEFRKIVFENKHLPIIGLTATPWSKGMARHYDELEGPLFEKMTIATTIPQLIQEGYLVDCEIYAPESPDMSGVKLSKNAFGEMDWSDADIGRAVDKPALIGGIVEHWLKLSAGMPTVCFASSINHSKNIVEEFRAAGVAAEHIDCYTKDYERIAILKRIESGETLVISNVGILTEGWDFPACRTMILARPTRSLIRYIQMIGRVLRPHETKEIALVLDHSGTVQRLGFPTDDLPMELDDGKVKEGKGEKKEIGDSICVKCKFVKPRNHPVCPKCGYVYRPKSIEHIPGELKKLEKSKATVADKQLWWGSFLHMAQTKGKSRSWALAQYKQKFGVWPKGVTESPTPPPPEVVSWVKSRQIAWANSQKAATYRSPA
jgi:superfamily II DNA or RNA helicase